MVPLFVVASLLLVASGLVKLKAAARVGMGLPLLVLAETGAGVGVLVLALAADLSPVQGGAILAGSAVLVVVSSLRVGAEVRRRQRIRNASEGARLATYVNVLSRRTPPAEEGGGGEGGAEPRQGS